MKPMHKQPAPVQMIAFLLLLPLAPLYVLYYLATEFWELEAAEKAELDRDSQTRDA